jgi:hypothetical protein
MGRRGAQLNPYDLAAYRTTRAAWAHRLEAGDYVACHLCGRPLLAGAPFDLDHVRGTDRLHPAHPSCNRAEGARHGQARRKAGRLGWGTGRRRGSSE